MQPSGRPPMMEVPGAFIALPIGNAVVEPDDEQSRDRRKLLPVAKQFDSIAKKTIELSLLVECDPSERLAGLNHIMDLLKSEVILALEQDRLWCLAQSQEQSQESPTEEVP